MRLLHSSSIGKHSYIFKFPKFTQTSKREIKILFYENLLYIRYNCVKNEETDQHSPVLGRI